MIINRVLKAQLLLCTLLGIFIITALNILVSYLILPGNLNQQKTIIIPKNISIHEISIILAQEEIIKYRPVFEVSAKIYSFFYRHLKSGEYEFTSSITPYQILLKLASGKSVIRKIIIPEGYTVSQIIDILDAEPRLFGTINTNIKEGHLMPSTYFYSYGDQKEKLIGEMLNQMSVSIDKVMLNLSPDSPLKTRQDVLTLASIVEKETGNEQERAIIAGVFIKRLQKGIKLQADPTVIYGITEGKYKMERLLTRTDLATDSEYNTYKINGLPKGAIACPSLASLKAVVNPAKTDALYFVSNNARGHYFAATLEEHNKNVEKFRLSKQSK